MSGETSDDPIEATWAEVLASFDDEAVHKKFLMLCAGLDRLAEAGPRYRAIKEDPDDPRAEMAARQVDRLLGLAMQNLQALKTEPPKRSGKTALFLMAVGVSGSIIVTALWLLMRVF